jgi:hypothetical protein
MCKFSLLEGYQHIQFLVGMYKLNL